MSTLYELKGQFKELLEMIEQGEYDEQTLKDTLEGIDGEIEIKADGYAKIIKEIEGYSSTLKAEITRLTSKKIAYESNIKAMKQNLETAMKETGKTKFKTELFSFGIQKNGGLRALTILDDVKNIPNDYLTIPSPVPNNEAIRELLKEQEVPWAKLEPQGESLRIR
jgi:hypothetical protein